MLSLFDGETTRLRHVRLRDASRLTVKGLKTLKGHRIVELEVGKPYTKYSAYDRRVEPITTTISAIMTILCPRPWV